MLYVSTRNNTDTFTAYSALHEDRAPDGGYFVPQRLQVLSETEIAEFTNMTFGERIARVLNLFFPVGLNGWDVEFTVGRHPCKLVTMSSRLYIAELWHNLQSNFSFWEQALYTKLCDREVKAASPTGWAKIAIRIAALFGIYGEIVKEDTKTVDFANTLGDCGFIAAAVYAQKMGLPIGKVICSGDENSCVWDLFRKGEIALVTTRPEENLQYLELLLYEVFGIDAVECYLRAKETESVFQLNREQMMLFTKTFDSTVISSSRCSALIRSIYRTYNYISVPQVAVTYGGLQDYRAKTGESRPTLLILDISPKAFVKLISEATGLTPDEIRKHSSNS